MDSRRARAGAQLGLPLLLFALGAAATLAWTQGLYANLVLALLLAAWTWLAMVARVRRAARTVAAPSTLPDRLADQSREHRRLTAYLNLSPAPLVTLDDDGRLHAVNRAARRLFGCEDMLGDPPAGLATAIAGAAPGRSASVALEVDGEPRTFALATADLLTGGSGSRIAALVDIDAELRAAEAGALRDLLQVLSHEIMNALTPIASLGRTAADMLAETGGEGEPVRDAVETIARRAEGLQRFASSYRDLARLPPPERRPIDLRVLLADLERLFDQRWPGVALTIAAPAVLRVSADADQVAAALWAIAQNAAEAVAALPDPTVRIDAVAIPNGAAITICDNGPGIPAAVRDSIFRPFFTTKAGGSGVGLALARQIALAHHGGLALDAGDGGACFRMTLAT